MCRQIAVAVGETEADYDTLPQSINDFGTRLSPKRLVMRPASAAIITPPESSCQQNAATKAPVTDASGKDAAPKLM
jgi:hypothetical protein